jgi:hypothetical protein
LPLGYQMEIQAQPWPLPVDTWGEGHLFHLRLTGLLPLHLALSHLYVLLPVLDNEKHYWVSEDEIDKLLRHGEGWLAGHPECAMITQRYLKHQYHGPLAGG